MPNFKDSDLTELHFKLTYYDEDDLREMIADLAEDLTNARAALRATADIRRVWSDRAETWVYPEWQIDDAVDAATKALEGTA